MLGFNLNHLFKHKFKDALTNLKLSRAAEKRARTYVGVQDQAFPPKEYNLVFEDNFKTRLNQDDWRYAMPWGDFHPGSLHQYYDNDGTLSYVAKHGGLVLELRKIAKSWKKKDLPDWRTNDQTPDEFTIPVGVGYVSTKKSWKYGWFEAWIQLPAGQSYWPAFWSCAVDGWPPEIDILEAYSQRGDLYAEKNIFGKKIPNRKIQPNLHYGKTEDGTKDAYGAYDIPVAKCTERFVQYACLWEEDKIEIYYDGNLVQRVTDPKILRWFNEGGPHFFILNHGLHQGYPKNPKESAMLVKSFKVYQRYIVHEKPI